MLGFFSQLTAEMRGLAPPGGAADAFQPVAVGDGLAPILFLLENVDQTGQGRFGMIGLRLFQQLPKQFLGPIEQASPQIILAEFEQSTAPLVDCQRRPGDQIAMKMDRSIDFAATPKQIAQGQMNLRGAPVHAGHAGKYFDSLIRLILDQIIQSLEIFAIASG